MVGVGNSELKGASRVCTEYSECENIVRRRVRRVCLCGARAPARAAPRGGPAGAPARPARARKDLCGPSAEVMILRQDGFVTFYV